MNSYEERKQARIDRLEERAARAQREADALISAGSEALAQIPFGQPILIGHHSERGDRAYRGRAISKIDRGMERAQQAKDLSRRAEAAASNRTISSDDPDASAKLTAKIAKCERIQETMKAANRIVQRKPKHERTDDKIIELEALGLPDPGRLFTPDCFGNVGFAGYALTNNGANIRRMKERLVQLETHSGAETKDTEHDGFTVREDADLNRVQIIFPGKPDEQTRIVLKTNGFRWAPSEGAWQRQLNGAGRWAAQCVAQTLEA